MGREDVYLIVAFVDFGAGFFSNSYTWSVLLLVMLQFAFAWYGYGRSHLPYILGKQVSIQEYCQRYDGRRLDHLLYYYSCGCSCLMPNTCEATRPRKDENDWNGLQLGLRRAGDFSGCGFSVYICS